MTRIPLAPLALAALVGAGVAAADPAPPSSHTTPPPPTGTLRLTVDNTLLGLWINGEEIPPDVERGGDWTLPQTVEFGVQPGRNVIAVCGRDEGVIAGLLAEVQVGGATLVSDGSWRVTPEAPGEWWRVDFDDAAWSRASTYGDWPGGVWGTRVQGWDGISADASWIWTGTNELNGAVDEVAYFRLTFDLQLGWAATVPGALPAVWADLDGDGRADQVRLRHDGPRAELHVTWGRGGREAITGIVAVEDGTVLEPVDDFSWLAHWEAQPSTGGGYDIPILGKPVRLERPEAHGDALYCSSTDVATLLYRTDAGWRLEHLGY